MQVMRLPCAAATCAPTLSGRAPPSSRGDCGARPQQPALAGSLVWRVPGGRRDLLPAADAARSTLHQTRRSACACKRQRPPPTPQLSRCAPRALCSCGLGLPAAAVKQPPRRCVLPAPNPNNARMPWHTLGNHPTGTPRGAPDSQTKHCIDGLHGNALAVGALLVASARSALGAPARLTSSVFWIAKRMISQPYCRWVGCAWWGPRGTCGGSSAAPCTTHSFVLCLPAGPARRPLYRPPACKQLPLGRCC